MVDNILISSEFHNCLKNIYELMHNNKQHSVEMVYQKFQIDNFVIDQIFQLKIQDIIFRSGVITLTNYLSITALPCNYQCHAEIDEIVFDTSYDLSNSHCKYTYNPSGYIAHHGEFTTTDLISIRNFMYNRKIYTYSLLQIKPDKIMNLISLISINCI